jgi:hypothetical protein
VSQSPRESHGHQELSRDNKVELRGVDKVELSPHRKVALFAGNEVELSPVKEVEPEREISRRNQC